MKGREKEMREKLKAVCRVVLSVLEEFREVAQGQDPVVELF